MGSVGTSILTDGQKYIQDSGIQEVSYDEATKGGVEFLTQIVDDNGGYVTMGDMIDNPIYPPNAELYDDFVDDMGFYLEDYISYLVRNSHDVLELDYDEGVEIIRRKKRR